LTTLIDGFKGKIDGLLANLPDALKNIIKPAIEGLMTKLKM
jgi:hypothetical protein